MMTGEYVVSPEILEKREFEFTPYQRNQIENAKRFGRDLRAQVVNSGGETFIFDLQIVF